MFQQPLVISILFGFLSFFATFLTIPLVTELFIRKGVLGKDLLKASAPVRAESMGVIVGVVYFVMMFMFIPIPFLPWIQGTQPY
jgi:UDP-N-acetylglucosamine--dolichyl-phosphate N-acetylglucosaminephosphotransferase